MKVLGEAGLVETEPCGRPTCYELKPDVLAGSSEQFAELAQLAGTAAKNERACP